MDTNASDVPLAITASSSSTSNRHQLGRGDDFQNPGVSEERPSLMLGTLESGTSFGSSDNIGVNEGLDMRDATSRMQNVDNQAQTVSALNATFTARSLPDPTMTSAAIDTHLALLDIARNPTNNFVALPPDILRRILAIAATASYISRLHLPLVCRLFHDVVHNACPEMWDTFEIMTGNGGALSSRPQVEYVVARSGERPLSIGIGVASCRLGAWREVADLDLDEEGVSSWIMQPVQKRGVKMIQLVLDLMPRVVDLTMDVQDPILDPELERAMLALFSDQNTTRLKRLTLLGTFQLNRIIRPTTPSSPTTVPSIAHLRHLTIAYAPQFRLSVQLPNVTILTMFMVQIESSSNATSLETVISGFPNLISLELLGVVHRMSSSSAGSQSRTGNLNKLEPKPISLPRLRRLVLQHLALTNSLFSSLLVPNVETLIMRDFEPGFDPRDIRFNTSLASHREPPPPPLSSGDAPIQEGSTLQSLPFGRFLANNDTLPQLQTLVLERIPDMVIRMCVDFVLIVDREGATATTGMDAGSRSDDRKGLRHLVLADFRWADWAPLFPPAAPHPLAGGGETPATAEATATIPLARLERLEIQIDHNIGLRIVGGNNNVRNETSVERQEWMDGLLKLAEWRMSRGSVRQMLREWNLEIPMWMHPIEEQPVSSLSIDDQEEEDRDQQARGGQRSAGRATAMAFRTIHDVSLATGYVDSYPFLHAAWVALQREHSQGREETQRSE